MLQALNEISVFFTLRDFGKALAWRKSVTAKPEILNYTPYSKMAANKIILLFAC